MAGNISDFRSSFTDDLSKTSRFDVLFNFPIELGSVTGIGAESISLRCDVSELPGRTFQLYEQKIYGPTEKYPFQAIYNDITFSFICTDNLLEKAVFENWLRYINPEEDWNFKYKTDSNYIQPILITQYNNDGTIAQVIKLQDAFPHTINSLDLNWSDDGYHKMAVTFSYFYWTVDKQPSVASIPSYVYNTVPQAGTTTAPIQTPVNPIYGSGPVPATTGTSFSSDNPQDYNMSGG